MDYIKETSRYLKQNGTMYIGEPTKKINQQELIGLTINLVFEIISIEYERNGKTYIEF